MEHNQNELLIRQSKRQEKFHYITTKQAEAEQKRIFWQACGKKWAANNGMHTYKKLIKCKMALLISNQFRILLRFTNLSRSWESISVFFITLYKSNKFVEFSFEIFFLLLFFWYAFNDRCKIIMIVSCWKWMIPIKLKYTNTNHKNKFLDKKGKYCVTGKIHLI